MDEVQLDIYMAQIGQTIEILRAFQKRPVVLTDAQEDHLAELERVQRGKGKLSDEMTDDEKEMRKYFIVNESELKRTVEYKKKEYLKVNAEEKLKRTMLLVSELEYMIRSAGLPAEATTRLLNIIQQAKDNGWKFSPDALNKLEKAKDEELAKAKAKAKEEQKDHAPDGDIIVKGAAIGTAAIVAGAVLADVAKEEKDLTQNSGVFATRIEMLIHMYDLSTKVGTKAINAISEEMGKTPEKVTLDDINRSKTINNAQRAQARKHHLETNEALRKDMEREALFILARSNARVERKYLENQAKKNGETLPPRTNERPNYTEEEWKLVKKVNKIKQRGKAITMEEVKNELSPEDAKAYDAFMRKHHSEFFVNQNREALKIALQERRKLHRLHIMQLQARREKEALSRRRRIARGFARWIHLPSLLETSKKKPERENPAQDPNTVENVKNVENANTRAASTNTPAYSAVLNLPPLSAASREENERAAQDPNNAKNVKEVNGNDSTETLVYNAVRKVQTPTENVEVATGDSTVQSLLDNAVTPHPSRALRQQMAEAKKFAENLAHMK